MANICGGAQSAELDEYAPGKYHVVVKFGDREAITFFLKDHNKAAAQEFLNSIVEHVSAALTPDIVEEIIPHIVIN